MDSRDGNSNEGRIGHSDRNAASGSGSGQRVGERFPQQPPPLESLELNEVELPIIANLESKVKIAQRELSIALTMVFAARGHKGKTMERIDLDQKRIFFRG
jgi:hypothetical protein